MRVLRETPPLVGTLGHSEAEVAAALVLLGLHKLGREWSASITARELGQVMSDAVAARGQEHHWLTAIPECPEDGEPYIPCKHCSARAAVCERCFEAPVFPRVSDQPLCTDCRLEEA